MQTLPPSLATAFWTMYPGQGLLQQEVLPHPSEGHVIVKTIRSGVSRGTESLVFRGEVPLSQHEVMRCPHQQGDFSGPIKYGYCSVGIVVDGPIEWIGRRVFCLYPHQDWYCVGIEWLVPIPDNVSDDRAVLAANMETALNGIWDATVHIGDRVAVVGAGVVGTLTASLATRITGTSVELIDINASRECLASVIGCTFATPNSAQRDADVVIHASGSAQGLSTALELAGFEATIVELSWFGTQSVSIPLGEAFHSRRLNLRSSQVGHVALTKRARWNHRRRMELALKLLSDPVFDALLSSSSHFLDLPQTMVHLTSQVVDELCHVVRYD